MLFLFFDNVDIDLISYALRYLAAKICGLLYRLIAGLFELFINISKVSILSSNDIQEIYKRVTLIITIVMVFYVTFETVKYVIQPETMTDKEKGASKIITKMIISVVLLAFVPNIFSFAFQVQNTIINQQVIPKVILGASNAASSNPKDMGRNFAATTFSMFYGYTYPNDPSNATNEVILNSCTEKDDYWTVMWPGDKNDGELNTVGRNLCTLKHTGKFYDIAYGIGEGSGVEDPSDDDNEIPLIDFDGLLAIIVGAFMIYVLALYCIDLGTRAAQLAFLQLIAPIPIIGYLSPKKDNMFSKWVQQCITTYLDLFLRTVLIYFVLFLCDTLNTARENGSLFNGLPADSDNTLIYIAIILGLLLFAQKAPKLLQELFPKMGAASGNFGLKAGERVAPVKSIAQGTAKLGKNAAKTVGMGRRAVGGAAGFVAGAVGGRSLRAALAGAKEGSDKNNKGVIKGGVINRTRNALNAGAKVRQNREDIRAAGGTPFGAEHRQKHYQNVAQEQDRRVRQLENMQNKKKDVSNAVEGLKFRKQMETMGQSIEKTDPAAGKAWSGVKKSSEKLARQYATGKINEKDFKDGVNKLINDFNKDNTQRAYDNFIKGGGNPRDFNMENVVQAVEFTDADFETDSANWGSVKTALDEAKKTAKIIKEQGYTWTDKDGNVHAVVDNEENIADDIGTFTDNASAAVEQEKSTEEYKRAHTNAKGSENSSGK